MSPHMAAAQNLRDLIEDFAGHFGDRLIDEVRASTESVAEVKSFDYSLGPSFLIETTDGRKFQVRTVGFATNEGSLLLAAQTAISLHFNHRGGRNYRVSATWLNAAAPNTMVGRAVVGATNDQLRKYTSFDAEIWVIAGKSLNGTGWVLLLDRTRLESLRAFR